MDLDGDDPDLNLIADRLSLVELVERLIRLRRFLKSKSVGIADPTFGISQILNAAVDEAISHLDAFVRILSTADSLNPAERNSLVRTTSRIYSMFQELHLLLRYLPHRNHRQETQVFLSSVLNQLNDNSLIGNKVNIVAHDLYSFEQNDIASEVTYILAKESGIQIGEVEHHPTVFLPFIEEDNPLYWANLVHECGHVEEFGMAKFLDKAERHGSLANETLRNWAQEFFCDLFAIKVLGPAYLASFLAYSLVAFGPNGPEHGSKSHPPDIVRISLMRDLLEKMSLKLPLEGDFSKFDSLNNLFFFVYESRSSILRRQVGEPNELVDVVVPEDTLNHFTEAIVDAIDDSIDVQKLIESDLQPIGPLSKRLQDGVLLSSISKEEELNRLASGKTHETVTNEEIAAIKMALEEIPAKPWEIINAGWLHKANHVYPEFFSIIFSSADQQLSLKIDELDKRLQQNDNLILKSIEASQIHTLLRANE